MCGLDFPTDDNVLVGISTGDDAGVYRISDELALIQTVDFFTPIVDDPYDFGRIAAANSLSDVYAMRGIPRTAMNIVTYPFSKLGKQVLRFSPILRDVLYDPQTSGGLLIGCEERQAYLLMNRLRDEGVEAAVTIGYVDDKIGEKILLQEMRSV